MAELAGNPGFMAPKLEETLSRRHAVAIELIATLALTVSLVVAATVVSMGNRALTRGDLVRAAGGANADSAGINISYSTRPAMLQFADR